MSGATPSVLGTLLAACPPAAARDETDWYAFVEHVAETLDIGPGTRVLDVACGAGAFLLPLWENGYDVGGFDTSDTCVRLAASAMPGGRFDVGVPGRPGRPDAWDVVLMSRGERLEVDSSEAGEIVTRMLAAASHAVAWLDLREVSRTGAATRPWLLRRLTALGVTGLRFEDAPGDHFHLLARV